MRKGGDLGRKGFLGILGGLSGGRREVEEKSGAFLLSPLAALGPEGTTASSIWDPRGLRICAGGLGTPSAFSTLWIGTWPL